MQSSLLNIQNELEKARERLKGVEENIKKSIGRDVNVGPPTIRTGFKRNARQLDAPIESPLRQRFSNESIKSRLGDFVRPNDRDLDFRGRVNNRRVSLNEPPSRIRKIEKDEGRISAKKRLGDQPQAVTVFSRLSGPPKDDEFDEKESSIKLTSQVIVQDTPSRKEVLAAQNGDNQSVARNRRMFGALLGTLQKFRQEENQLKEKEEKRAQVEKKLEEAALREKEELKKKRQELFSCRRQQQIEIRQLEFKLLRLKQLTEWETSKKHLLNFIQTSKALPKIFYLPKVHNEKTQQLLEESQKNILKIIEAKRAEVEKAIADHAASKKSAKDVEENHHDVEEEHHDEDIHQESMEVAEEGEVHDDTLVQDEENENLSGNEGEEIKQETAENSDVDEGENFEKKDSSDASDKENGSEEEDKNGEDLEDVQDKEASPEEKMEDETT